MRPVSGGTQKLTMDSKERDYQQRLRQAQAQADGNPFVAGVQEVFSEGAASGLKNSQYGDQPIKTPELLQGWKSNFAQKDAPGNAPLEVPYNQTGSVDLKMSTATDPQRDMEQRALEKMEERLELYRTAGSNASFGNNNRQETMRLN